MSKVTQSKYDHIKQLINSSDLNNKDIGAIVGVHGCTVARVKKSNNLEAYRESRRVLGLPKIPDFTPLPVQLELSSTPTVIGELTRIADALDHIVEVLER